MVVQRCRSTLSSDVCVVSVKRQADRFHGIVAVAPLMIHADKNRAQECKLPYRTTLNPKTSTLNPKPSTL